MIHQFNYFDELIKSNFKNFSHLEFYERAPHVTEGSEALSKIKLNNQKKISLMMNQKYLGWHVLYVKSRHEKKVLEALKKLSLEAFLPLVKTKKKWSDRTKIVELPLIPSYVFVNSKSPKDFHRALSADGACAYIRFGSSFAKVSEKEIVQLKLLAGSEDAMNIEVGSQVPKVGELREIEFGALRGLQCEILEVNNVNKIVVRIEQLQQNITAILPSYYFESEAVAV
jgi:transcription antitermination factor NusG